MNVWNQSLKHRLAAALCAVQIAACSNELNNDLPRGEDDAAQNERLDGLETDVAVTQANDRQREQGLALTKQTVSETNDYLRKLYQNINDTRPQDLPEWGEMYAVLTDDRALTVGAMPVGPRGLRNNFEKLNERADAQQADTLTINQRIAAIEAADAMRDSTLQTIQNRLATIDKNIADMNATVKKKFEDVDKLLSDYEGRIKGIENRMQTLETDVDRFRREFVEYRQRVNNIEDLLRRYDPATMHNDIRNLNTTAANHEERLIALQGTAQTHTSEITALRLDLTDAERELAGVSSEVGTQRSAIAEILVRLENCACQ